VADFSLACPIPIDRYPHVLLAHGGGGRLMHQLIEKMFGAGKEHDSAVLPPVDRRIAFTTDSFVVNPLRFPGGDIGSLAVYGTVNDLAMSGARPLYLSTGFILEEGLSMELLWEIVLSMRRACERAGVRIVTGDTKVVDRGKGDGMYINTSGVGVLDHELVIAPSSVRPGDAIVVSGDLGRHGIAVMATREGLAFESEIESDAAPLADLVRGLIDGGIEVHCLRDLTRGGLSSALNEIAGATGLSLHVDERSIPVREDVRGACEMLGLDPLYVANEGRLVAFVPASQAEAAVRIMRGHGAGSGACVAGRVGEAGGGGVTLRSVIGVDRVLDMPAGEQLPRIC
jgi:hydrogenase expression/formation protein HypE